MKKKVLFILHYPPPVHGAAMVGQYIIESKMINEAYDCKYINLSLSFNIDEIGKNGLKKWKRYFTILWASIRALYFFKPKLVYLTLTASGMAFYKDATIGLLAKMMGKQVVYHFHNKGVTGDKIGLIKNLANKLVFKNAKVILLSEYLYYDIEKYVSIEDVSYCANGVPEIGSFDTRENRPTKKAEILFLSNLILSKGVYVLLEACKILTENKVLYNCTFVGGEGDINGSEFVDKVNELNLQGYVKYVGKKYGKNKEEVYGNSDIFVLPTYYHNECFPLVLLEAMQYSLPVVTTSEGGIREIVVDNVTGFIVPSLNSKVLAEKLQELIIDPKKGLDMGRKGYSRYKENFTLEVFEIRLKSILNEIL